MAKRRKKEFLLAVSFLTDTHNNQKFGKYLGDIVGQPPAFEGGLNVLGPGQYEGTFVFGFRTKNKLEAAFWLLEEAANEEIRIQSIYTLDDDEFGMQWRRRSQAAYQELRELSWPLYVRYNDDMLTEADESDLIDHIVEHAEEFDGIRLIDSGEGLVTFECESNEVRAALIAILEHINDHNPGLLRFEAPGGGVKNPALQGYR